MVANFHAATGECPLWHRDRERLYWTDIPRGELFWYRPDTGESARCYQGRPVGGFTIQADGSLLLFRDRGNVAVFREGEPLKTVLELPGLEDTRFNDVIADPEGRVFAGTMSSEGNQNGKLFRIDSDGSYTLISEGHGTPNGMAFSPDLSRFYFTDSRLRRIYVFDYERHNGRITAPKIWQEVEENAVAVCGRSDGMTVAEDGSIWSARMDRGAVDRYSPEGELLERLEIGTPKVTSLTFAGPAWTDLYVTTAGGDFSEANDDPKGALFHLEVGSRGRPEFFSGIRL